MDRIDTAALKDQLSNTIDQHRAEIIDVAKHVCDNPEPGYTERKTARFMYSKLQSLGLDLTRELAITGIKGVVAGGAGPGPSVALIGELDSLRVGDHPFADPETGAAHACGHHCQMGILYGALVGLVRGGVLKHLSGRAVAIAVPAEEFIDIEDRMALREAGAIEFLGGKQEFIKLGLLHDVDMALLCHTLPEQDLPGGALLAVGGTNNGHVAKLVEYFGRGAHAGSAPHEGVNALNAAMTGLTAINANRETFREADMVRVHGIMTRGGEAVSAIPSHVTLEWRVRAASPEAVVRYSDVVDRAFKAGALGVGAKVRITNIPGYLPTRNDRLLQDVFVENARRVVGKEHTHVWPENFRRGSSSDMGDVSSIMPALTPYCGGVTGTPHGSDYIVRDYGKAVINPAMSMAMTVVDLLSGGGSKATEVLEKHQPAMTKDAYLRFQRARAHVVEFDGAG